MPIYNSRNLIGLKNSIISEPVVMIYNSRNLIGLKNKPPSFMASASTIVEI